MNLSRLFAARARQWRSRIWTRELSRVRLRDGALTLAMSLVLTAMLTWALDAYFVRLATTGVPIEQAARALGWVFSIAITALVVLDLHHVFAAMIAGADLDLLRLAPLSRRDLSLLLLFDAVPYALPPVLCLAAPAALAFQHAYGGAPPLITLLALLTLLATPVAAGIALALPLARLIPPRLMRELLGLLATATLVLAWLANSFLLPHAIPGEGGASDILATLTRALPPAPPWSPATWSALALAGGEPAAPATMALAIALAGAAVIAWLSAWLHVETARRLGSLSERTTFIARGPVRVSASVLAAFLVRDWRMLTRDWSVAADIGVTALLWSLLPLVGTPLLGLEAETLGRAVLILLAVGLGHEIGSRVLALERAGIAWARLSPLGGPGWIRARFTGACVPGFGLLIAGAGFTLPALRLELAAAMRCLVLGCAALPVAIALGLWVGARFSDYSWSQPRAMLRVPGRLISTLLLIAQAAGWLAAAEALSGMPFRLLPTALAGAFLLWAALLPALLSAAGKTLSRAADITP